jgi:CBS-domain-containing membrane protein
MLAHELMTRDAVTVRPDTAVRDALALLSEHGITSLPVVDTAGRIRGVVSEADLIRELVPSDPRAHELVLPEESPVAPRVVAEVMTTHAVTVRPETDVAAAVELLTSTSVKSVPVVDQDQRVVGVLSRSDVVRAMARTDADLSHAVDALLESFGLEGWSSEAVDGHVRLSGPEGSPDRALAHLAARTVPGVVEVRDAAPTGAEGAP